MKCGSLDPTGQGNIVCVYHRLRRWWWWLAYTMYIYNVYVHHSVAIRIRQFLTFLKIDEVIGPIHLHPTIDALRKKVWFSIRTHTLGCVFHSLYLTGVRMRMRIGLLRHIKKIRKKYF